MKHFLWWVEQIILTKNIFLAHFGIIRNFHHFPKVRACRYYVKNSIFQKLPKIVEKHFLWWVEQIILTKIIFSAPFKIIQNFNHFCSVSACRYSVKNSIFQKLSLIVEKHFLWWAEQIELTKNTFLAHFEIIQNFHYFCKVSACRYYVKNSIFQKLPKIVEKHFLWWVEQIILTKIFSWHLLI